jgi:hypothetical protein
MQQVPARKHSIAIDNFETGQVQIIEADEYRACIPTKSCVQFWATIVACFICIIFALVVMPLSNPCSVLFHLAASMLGLAVGVLIPSPDYISAFKVPRNQNQAASDDAAPSAP